MKYFNMGKTHGMRRSVEYSAWAHILQRCYNPNDNRFWTYGGRGISVCERWLNSFENFFADMGFRPSKAHSVDRIDNDGNYEPTNCRWTTRVEQIRNRTNTKIVLHNGEMKSLPEWCEILGLKYKTIFKRLTDGWEIGDALTIQIRPMKKFIRRKCA